MRTLKLLGAVGVVLLVLAACLMVPCVQRLPDDGPRVQSASNIKWIGLALLGYYDTYKKLPPAVIRDKEGKPLYSWRVALLPWVEQTPLYNEFKLDEPWDSPHNKNLLERIPPVYRIPWPDDPPNTTRYQAFTGPGTLFDRRDANLEELAAAILVIESGQLVPWSKPADLAYDPNGPLPVLGAGYSKARRLLCYEVSSQRGFNTCFGDGRLRFLRENADEQVLRSLITGTAGTNVDWSKVE